MRKTILALMTLAGVGVAMAQQHDTMNLPAVPGSHPETDKVANDPLSRYKSPHEGAVKALQAAYDAATISKNQARAIQLFLISLKRDATPEALYDLGILCAQTEHWLDAVNFQREALGMANVDPAVTKLATTELERVRAIIDLESTPTGQRQRSFNIEFLPILKVKDPLSALTELRRLEKKDKTRWEAPALEGILQAELRQFPDSLKALEEAVRIAPSARRQQLKSAADLARRESNFKEEKNQGDSLIDKQQYEAAAKHYENAWENSGQVNVGMQAAAGYLMADQVDPAVSLLARMRTTASADDNARITAMLKELGAVSAVARSEAARPASASAGAAPGADTASQMRVLIGELTTRQMEVTASPAPALLKDATKIDVTDDELTTGRADDVMTNESIFDKYRAAHPAISAAASPDSATNQATPAPAAVEPLAPPPSPLPERPAAFSASTSEPPARAAGGQNVSVTTDPAGATVSFDNNALQCTAPCPVSLAAGPHSLRATLNGYRDALRNFNVEKKKPTDLNVAMEAKIGTVSVTTDVPGAPIFVNGKKIDQLTPGLLKLNEGDYEIAVEIDGKMSQVLKITVQDRSMGKAKF